MSYYVRYLEYNRYGIRYIFVFRCFLYDNELDIIGSLGNIVVEDKIEIFESVFAGKKGFIEVE